MVTNWNLSLATEQTEPGGDPFPQFPSQRYTRWSSLDRGREIDDYFNCTHLIYCV